ncbi:hypothetical protein LSAT2_024540 [Lamellibrachia satsuma]|nr:hypothetical protein LSAT2_024540 [Lamellibrachia satsuma]
MIPLQKQRTLSNLLYVDECESKPCQNGGTCTDGGVNTYTCSCAGGYSGLNCQNDVDECDSKPCQNGGTCTDGGVNTYTCSCAGGYSGLNCQNGVRRLLLMPLKRSPWKVQISVLGIDRGDENQEEKTADKKKITRTTEIGLLTLT